MGMGVGRMLVGPSPGPAASWVWECWAAGRPPRVSQPRHPPKLPAAVDRVERGPRERQLVGQVLSCARRVAPRAPPPAWADASPGNMWLSGRLQNIRGLAVAVVATRSFPQRAGWGLSCRFRHILVISSKRGMRSREGGESLLLGGLEHGTSSKLAVDVRVPGPHAMPDWAGAFAGTSWYCLVQGVMAKAPTRPTRPGTVESVPRGPARPPSSAAESRPCPARAETCRGGARMVMH